MERTAVLSTTDLSPYLVRLRRRLRLRDGWLLAQRSLWIACAGMVLIQLAGRMWPILRLWLWTPLPMGIWMAVAAGLVVFRPMSLSSVAHRSDAELGLKERLSTAISLEEWEAGTTRERTSAQPVSRRFFQPSLVALQRADALTTVQGIEPRRAFPLSWLRRPLWIASVWMAATLVLAVLPNRMNDVLAERAEVAQAVVEQAQRIEQLTDEISRAQELSPEEREELQRQLAELVEQLRQNRGNREKALADLSRLEESLRREIDPNADARQASLEALAAQLQALAAQEGDRHTDAAEADPADMEETLQSLAENLAGASEADRQALSDRLGQMAAGAAQTGNAALAQALADMARAAQAGDANAVSQAAQAASEAMRATQSELEGEAARQRALSQLQQSRQSIAAAGSGQGQQSSGQAQQPGQGTGQGQGQGQGQAPGSGQGQSGQGTGGQGTKADQLPPGTGRGEADRPQGEGRSGARGDLDQQIYAPVERRPGSGDVVTIPGQDTGQGETEVRERTDPLPGSSGETLVPYYEVYYEYLDAANETIEQSYIPSGLKDIVREYFSKLEP